MTPTLSSYLSRLRECESKATKVVAWYPHGAGNVTDHGLGTVRGPFHRWFKCSEVAPQYRDNVASVENDVNYCATAMNEFPKLLQTGGGEMNFLNWYAEHPVLGTLIIIFGCEVIIKVSYAFFSEFK